MITTVVGIGSWGFSGDGGPATAAALNGPFGVALDVAGNLYIGDSSNHRVRKVAGLARPSDPTGPQVPDTTGPSIQYGIVGTQGANDWYTSDVSVAWTVTDPESAVSSSSGCDAASVTTDTTSQTFTCTATSDGGPASQSVTVKRDTTEPTASSSRLPMPNGNGWNAGDVTVHFTGADVTSGIASCTADESITTEGTNQSSSTGTCTDNAGNVSASVFADNINIDMTAPFVSGVALPVPGASGWNTTTVTVSFSGLDGLSGVPIGGCVAPVTLTTDGQSLSVPGQCGDRAGNVGSAIVTGISIDKTAPMAVASRAPAANADGWNNTSVTVSFDGADSLSGSGLASCSSPVVLAAEGANQSASGTCDDVATNTSPPASITGINIDTTAPAVPTILKPILNDGFVIGETPRANYSCTDALSGMATCSGPVTNGSAINTSALGAKTFMVTATDRAANAQGGTQAYTVNPLGTAIITSIAGDGRVGFSGDGGPATSATLRDSGWMAVDAAGNLYINVSSDHRIRKITPAGIITTIAGNGTPGFSGDGGPATSASLDYPRAVTVDAAGNLYIADTFHFARPQGNARPG